MKITLCAVEEDLFHVWKNEFNKPGVVLPEDVSFDFYLGSILDLSADAIVSPANSFGFMDGSLDLIYTEFFGRQLQQRLKDQLRNIYGDELLVGQTAVVATEYEQIPWLISAPTMRTPRDLTGTVNVYLAARAILRAVRIHRFGHVLVPGLGTGVGCLEPRIAAVQMRRGFVDAAGLKPVGSLWERSLDERNLIVGNDTKPIHLSLEG